MKNTLLLLIAAFSLSACNPRDPDVLGNSADNRKNNGFSDSAGQAKLPQKVEMAVGVLAEGRAVQAQQILELAKTLAASNESVVEKGCVRSKLLNQQASEKTYQVSFDQCRASSDVADANFDGVSDLKLQLDNNQLVGLEFSSDSSSTPDDESNVIQVYKKNAKDTLLVRDSVGLSMKKSQAGFDVIGRSKTAIQSGYKDSLTATDLAITWDGSISNENQLSWHSKVQGEAQNLTQANSNRQIFWMLAQTEKDPGVVSFKLQFGKSNRGGTLVFSENDVTLIGKNDKSKKEDKVTVSRKKSPSIEGTLPWDFWF